MTVAPSSPSAMLTRAHASSNPDKAIRVQRANEYPHEVWFFLACMIGLIAVFRFLAFVSSKVFRRRNFDLSQDSEKGFSSQSTNRALNLRNIPLVLVNMYRITAFRFTLDFGSFSINLAEVVLTSMYMAALFVWAFINTTDVSGTKFDVAYWSNRTGVLAASQLPLITALGTKNNVISWITGVSYEKLNYLHRMSARVVFVLSWVHAGSRVSFSRIRGLSKDLSQPWLIWGLLATSCLSLLCIISIKPVRSRAYEFFFYSHLALVLFQTYVWPSFVVWGVERAIRFVRVILLNHSFSGNGTLDATTELLTPKLVRLTLKRPQHFKWSPGQAVYLITPSVSTLPFEAHPFTIASYDSQMLTSPEELSSSAVSTCSSKNNVDVPSSSLQSHWKEVVFLINVREGFTKRLSHIAARKGTFKVYIDGPYGHSHDSSSYDTSVFIAGGTGVSYTLPLLLATIEGARKGQSICQRVTFIWCIRDSEHIKWISDVLAQALTQAPDFLKIDIRIFVTESSQSSDSLDLRNPGMPLPNRPAQTPISEKGVGIPSSSVLRLIHLSSVKVSQGRPILAKLLAEEAEKTRGGSMWVTGLRFPVSGPSVVLRGGASVTLHVESFGYA
ncbi:hypothetical protein BT96DRAFT_921065 [Gymnopus androsaceus JB14]|uniref:ferric-chelate reductase (NADPH) n=1 Tax=Gymnopus androsaceus JB14 TaxID=1447944 RepID=A0A6A4HLM0_9AGAR|nr:hypothetical protein BT96DRAFT_921065 [Gymnopus androsaceus JB14]